VSRFENITGVRKKKINPRIHYEYIDGYYYKIHHSNGYWDENGRLFSESFDIENSVHLTENQVLCEIS